MARNPVRKIYEEPWVFVWIILFGSWLYSNNTNRVAGIVLFMLAVSGYFFYKEIKGTRFQINSVKNNLGQSIVLALVGLVITIIGTFVVSYILGTLDVVSGAISGIGSVLAFMKLSAIGSGVSPFANNAIMQFVIFGLAFPIAETVVILSAFKFILSRFKTPIKFSNPLVWLVSFAMGGFAILYHIYAKMTTPGRPNVNALMVIWVLFTTECLMTVYSGEQEPAILHHIANNFIALSFA